MENSYDIDALATKVLDYLTSHYPLPQESAIRWSTKVRRPSIRWKSLPPTWYGYCDWSNHGLVLTLSYTRAYTQEELIDTIAHEYRHMMQDKYQYRWLTRRYRTQYWEHPLEKDARAFAEKILAELSHLLDLA
jgi:hypothetical protein